MKLSKRNKIVIALVLLFPLSYFIYRFAKKINPNPKFEVGQKIDSLNGVYVYYNGGIDNVEERNLSVDGYNLGLKYQCVEFVKRYYYEYYKHKMPDSYGNAKDFFDLNLSDGALNKQRSLLQYKNSGISKPEVGDLIVMAGHAGNPYGHVAIVSFVNEKEVEIIQQNPGPFSPSRQTMSLTVSYKVAEKGNLDSKWKIESDRVLGWLRMVAVPDQL